MLNWRSCLQANIHVLSFAGALQSSPALPPLSGATREGCWSPRERWRSGAALQMKSAPKLRRRRCTAQSCRARRPAQALLLPKRRHASPPPPPLPRHLPLGWSGRFRCPYQPGERCRAGEELRSCVGSLASGLVSPEAARTAACCKEAHPTYLMRMLRPGTCPRSNWADGEPSRAPSATRRLCPFGLTEPVTMVV